MAATGTVLITGATSGLGLGVAGLLARDPAWHVIVTGRDPGRTAAAAATIGAEPAALDLGSLDGVRSFGSHLPAVDRPPLRAIVANAGLQHLCNTAASSDGFEETFAVNHLGHFLLVQLLFGQLAPPARVVIVSSGTHDPQRRTGMPAPHYTTAVELSRADPAWAHDDSPATAGRRRYTTSKLCNVLFTYELERRLGGRGVTFNVFDPGLMPGTGLARDYPGYQRLVWRYLLPALTLVNRDINTPRQTATALARLVTDPSLEEVSGRYFSGERSTDSSRESHDPAKATDLWDTSLALCGLTADATAAPPAG